VTFSLLSTPLCLHFSSLSLFLFSYSSYSSSHPARSRRWYNEDLVRQTLRMYACARIVCHDVNIAATTALEVSNNWAGLSGHLAGDVCSVQVLSKTGRQQALQAGSNILMPNITPRKYRDGYEIYQTKAQVDGGGVNSLLPVGSGREEFIVSLSDSPLWHACVQCDRSGEQNCRWR